MQHWVTICSIDAKVLLYDSLPMKTLPDEIRKEIIALYGKDPTSMIVTIPVVQKQRNRIDCGCFAIAWALHLAMGEKPELMISDPKQLRPHLIKCFQAKMLTPFLRSLKQSQRTQSKTIELK